MIRWVKRLGLAVGLMYVVLCACLYAIQDRFIFNPQPLPSSFQFRMGEEVEIEVEKDVNLSCLWIKETQAAKGVILYLHGNKGSNKRCLRQAQSMLGNDYDLFMPDYRGYGKSDGEIESEEQILSDVQQVYNFLTKYYEEQKIIIVGYSLGSGMASYLAAKNDPQQLVLLAPYLSLVDMKDRILPIIPDFVVKYSLDNYRYLSSVRCPTTLFHGSRDEVIPFDSSEQLQQLRPENITLIPVEKEGHRGLIFSAVFRNGFRALLLEREAS